MLNFLVLFRLINVGSDILRYYFGTCWI